MKLLLRHKGIEYYFTDNFMYAKKDGDPQLYKLALFDRHFYKLRLFNRIPILEIDGLRMQLVRDFKTPLDYPKEVVRTLTIKKGESVLDTCTGLGYIAIEAEKCGAKITTCELSPAVIALAKWNPWSDHLFSSSSIESIQGDIAHLIKGMKDKTFDIVIHDPPRFSHAPDLYSQSFYRELFRVLKGRGRLFHYVGSVGESRGRSLASESSRRLASAGFKEIKENKRLQGVFARK
ncbi:MAG: methyltransferase domain-containing protein [Candidatus Micrarchaeota archaeon]|mgnify:CR=1 FL=1